MAAHLLEAAAADVEYQDGAFQGGRSQNGRLASSIWRAPPPGGRGCRRRSARPSPPRRCTRTGRSRLPTAAKSAGFEVDPETGAVQIVALTIVDDSGRSVNPMIVHGQMHGAIAQGIGQALTERCVYDPASGQLLSGSFLDYAIPRADDLPSIAVTSRDVPSPTNPLGVKGAGEGATVGAPGAVIHAILDALAPLGVTDIDMPATPSRCGALSRARGDEALKGHFDMASTTTEATVSIHPLDPLSAAEIARAWEIVRTEHALGAAGPGRSSSCSTSPRRRSCSQHRPGDAVERAAFVVLVDSATGEDLRGGGVASPRAACCRGSTCPACSRPSCSTSSWRCEAAVRADPRWQEAMRRRGVTDPEPGHGGRVVGGGTSASRRTKAAAWSAPSPGCGGTQRTTATPVLSPICSPSST